MLRRWLASGRLRVAAAALAAAGTLSAALAPLLGEAVSESLWGIEPMAYAGSVALIAGLGLLTASYAARGMPAGGPAASGEGQAPERWSEITQRYFEVFHHDLGRPLSRIVGKERELRAALQERSGEIDPAVADLLDEIERQAPNFRLMMSNLQALIQLEGGPTTVREDAVEPAEVVRRIVERYHGVAVEAGKQITWWSEPAEFGIVYSDGSAIEHIVTNLIDNAIKYTAEGGTIRLTLIPGEADVTASVTDTGRGISAAALPHIFERFYRAEAGGRDTTQGTGLGLAIADRILSLHGSACEVESTPGQGSVFSFHLPRASAA